jgi:hypothetical protein
LMKKLFVLLIVLGLAAFVLSQRGGDKELA